MQYRMQDMAPRLSKIQKVIDDGPYEESWGSLCGNSIPAWFADAKFGIFTHWGLYTVPEYRNEWYSRNMYIQGYPEFEHHRTTYGPQDRFGYKDFIPLFTAERFDADEWLDLFKEAGAQYYCPVSEHHDGFQMYRSEVSHWNAAEMGPRRDVLGLLRDATTRHGMHFAASNHRAEHWWFMGHGKEFDSDVKDPMRRGDFYWPANPEPDNQDLFSLPRPDGEFLDDWLIRVCEVIDNYRPELLYFDWWIQHEAFKSYLRKMAAFYYNRAHEWGVPVSICYKDDAMAWGSGLPEVERGGFADIQSFVWQTDTAIARNSWCYTKSLEYKGADELIVDLIDAVSKNGNMLLNVGPRADGSISGHDRALLQGIGAWMRTNSEGIYGTRPWKYYGEGPTVAEQGSFSDQHAVEWTSHDFRFTTKDGDIYAFCLNPQHEKSLTLTTFASYHDGVKPRFHGIIREVQQLGAGRIPFSRTDMGLIVHPLPVADAAEGLPMGLRISVE